MKIIDIINGTNPSLSFEVFPPKTHDKYDSVSTAIKEIAHLNPSYMSVTYGAGGGTSEYTAKIAQEVSSLGVTSLAHLTCISSTRELVREQLNNLKSLGIENIILSPELTLPQIRDIKGDTSTIIYGRIPLMLLEKCVASEVTSCDHCAKGIANITDRRGISFPILREFEHRNVIYNSAPTYMADKESELSRAGITNRHFIFSTESKNEVDYIISCHENQSSAKVYPIQI